MRSNCKDPFQRLDKIRNTNIAALGFPGLRARPGKPETNKSPKAKISKRQF